VNVDGMIPLPGQSIRDLIPDVWARSRKRARASGDAWWVPPPDWDFGLSPEDLAWVRPRLTPDPMRTWTTPIHYTPERAGRVPALFIHCAEGLPAEEVHAEEQNCRKLGWAYEALPATHDPMVSSPDLLAELLLRRLTGGGRGPGSTAPEVAAGARCLGCNDVPIVSRARAPGGALRSSELSVR
jgi:hypothetical protein